MNLVTLTACVGRTPRGDWTYKLYIPGEWLL
jgi:hypothetical protein